MRKVFIASACLLTTLISAPSFEVSAATSAKTTCNYTLVAGAPWAEKYRTTHYTGHIKCPGELIGAIGYWRMTNEIHS